MKYKNNCGVDSSTLERGYSDTGHIPEEGESVFKAEKSESCCVSPEIDVDVGGFIERNNYYDRI